MSEKEYIEGDVVEDKVASDDPREARLALEAEINEVDEEIGRLQDKKRELSAALAKAGPKYDTPNVAREAYKRARLAEREAAAERIRKSKGKAAAPTAPIDQVLKNSGAQNRRKQITEPVTGRPPNAPDVMK